MLPLGPLDRRLSQFVLAKHLNIYLNVLGCFMIFQVIYFLIRDPCSQYEGCCFASELQRTLQATRKEKKEKNNSSLLLPLKCSRMWKDFMIFCFTWKVFFIRLKKKKKLLVPTFDARLQSHSVLSFYISLFLHLSVQKWTFLEFFRCCHGNPLTGDKEEESHPQSTFHHLLLRYWHWLVSQSSSDTLESLPFLFFLTVLRINRFKTSNRNFPAWWSRHSCCTVC